MKYKFKVVDKKTREEGIPLRITINDDGFVFAAANDYPRDKMSRDQFYPRDFDLIIEEVDDEKAP